ncbi:hypothetical protein ACFV0C_38535, partial [Streptomyces sp. NPDC059568]|uniref:hypothetical protein n=1 Tax=Streptomyces sp. NPDC059568 TaxID=3346868 RepID=UPI00369B29D1
RNPHVSALLARRTSVFRETFMCYGREQAQWIDSMLLLWQQLDGEIRPLVEGAGLKWMPLQRYRHLRTSHAGLTAMDEQALIRDFNTLDVITNRLQTGSPTQRASAQQALRNDAIASARWSLFLSSLGRILQEIDGVGR